MYQRHDWVIFHKQYDLKLAPTALLIFNRGEKGEVVDVVEENGRDTYWIKLHHRDMIIAISESIIGDYIEGIDYDTTQ